MRRPWMFLAFLMLACTAEPETVMANRSEPPTRLADPDFAYRLTSSERARVLKSYDADALERLLQNVRSEERAAILRQYVQPRDGEGGAPSKASTKQGTLEGGTIKDVEVVMGFGDPVLDDLLAEVWAPFWDALPADVLDREDTEGIPGRERARARRERAKQADRK